MVYVQYVYSIWLCMHVSVAPHVHGMTASLYKRVLQLEFWVHSHWITSRWHWIVHNCLVPWCNSTMWTASLLTFTGSYLLCKSTYIAVYSMWHKVQVYIRDTTFESHLWHGLLREELHGRESCDIHLYVVWISVYTLRYIVVWVRSVCNILYMCVVMLNGYVSTYIWDGIQLPVVLFVCLTLYCS